MLLSSKAKMQNSVQQLVLKMHRNEKNLGTNIINGYNFFNNHKNEWVCIFDFTIDRAMLVRQAQPSQIKMARLLVVGGMLS